MTLPDIDTLGTFGGPLSDYAPPEDPTTDRSALGSNTALADVAMMTHTALRAFCSFVTNNTSTPTDPAAFVHDAQWGGLIGVKPVIARTGVGIFTVTWPASVSDEGTVLNQVASTHTLNLRYGKAHIVSGTTPYLLIVSVSANVATVRIYNTSGSAVDTTSVQIYVEAL